MLSALRESVKTDCLITQRIDLALIKAPTIEHLLKAHDFITCEKNNIIQNIMHAYYEAIVRMVYPFTTWLEHNTNVSLENVFIITKSPKSL